MKYRIVQSVFVILIAWLTSCKKEAPKGTELFLGKWKTSYGDTIVFSNYTGTNNITYKDRNTLLGDVKSKEFSYQDNKLGIKNWSFLTSNDFHFFQTFSWVQQGQIFEIQGIEWNPVISSTIVRYQFTKIP